MVLFAEKTSTQFSVGGQANAQEPYRQSPSDIGRLYARGTNNQMVPVSALTSTSFRSAPTVVSRFNGFTSAQFTGPPKAGHSSGELLSEVDQLIQTQFASSGLGVSYSGQSYQERASSGAAALVFVLGLIMVFLVLAAQFESWSVPFADRTMSARIRLARWVSGCSSPKSRRSRARVSS